MRYLTGATAALWLLACSPVVWGQAANNPVIQAPTTPLSTTITTGLTYQLILPAQTIVEPPLPGARHSLTIQNNNVSAGALSSDLCYLIVANSALAAQITPGTTTTSSNVTVSGKTITAAQASVVLSGGGSFQRYFPYIPSDAIYGTCATTADTLYVDTQ